MRPALVSNTCNWLRVESMFLYLTNLCSLWSYWIIFRVSKKEGESQGVDSQLDLVGNEMEGQPGRVSYWEERIV